MPTTDKKSKKSPISSPSPSRRSSSKSGDGKSRPSTGSPSAALRKAAPHPDHSRIRSIELSPLIRKTDTSRRAPLAKSLRSSSADALDSGDDDFPDPPVGQAVSAAIIRCNVLFDNWSDDAPPHYVELRDRKTSLLGELVSLASQKKIPETAVEDLIDMIFENIDRPLPARIGHFDASEDDPNVEPQFPHILLCYELFAALLETRDLSQKIAPSMGHAEVLMLCELMNSEIPAEREILKTIIHRVYSKFVPVRAVLRKAMGDIFVDVIQSRDHHNGMSELLEILGSIINGFVVPLKEDHINFLFSKLLPLYRGRCLQHYCAALTYCVTEYMSKEPKLVGDVMQRFCLSLPRRDSSKALVFIQELEELVAFIPQTEYHLVVAPLCRLLASLIRNDHFQVAERALTVFHNQTMISMISQFEIVALPLIFPALERNKELHWHNGIGSYSAKIFAAFRDINPVMYKTYELRRVSPIQEAEQREKKWRSIEALAAKNAPDCDNNNNSRPDYESDVTARKASQKATALSEIEHARLLSKNPSNAERISHESDSQGDDAPPSAAEAKSGPQAEKKPEKSSVRKLMPKLQETGQTPQMGRLTKEFKGLKVGKLLDS